MNAIGMDDSRTSGERRVRATAPARSYARTWYPMTLVFQYRAFSGDRLVHTGVGETVEICSRAVRLRVPKDLPTQVEELELAIAWPVPLGGVTPLQWIVKAKPVWRAPGWVFVCIASHELRTASTRKLLAMAACG